jgi:bla regulator protein blaR1
MIAAAYLALLLHLFQQTAPPPSFEVASIKRNIERGPAGGGACRGIDSPASGVVARTPLGRCVFTRTFGYHLVTYAYGLEDGPLTRNIMIRNVPDWFRTEIYDVATKAAEPTAATEQQLIEMLRTLLAERFKLKVHYETIEVPAFTLVQSEARLKIQRSKDDEPRRLIVIPGKKDGPPGSFRQVKAQRYTLADFALVLSGPSGGPITDKTGLEGPYNFDLSWDVDLGPSIFTAVSEQLGLRLVPAKAPVKFLMIDSVERPESN